MGAVYFYHLTRSPLEVTLVMLIDRALGRGWRVAVRGRDAARLDWLDRKLWMGSEEGFLPHGIAGGPHDELQPVLLTTAGAEGRDCLMAVDGADLGADEAQAAARACILFDDNDPAAVEAARGQWKALTRAGLSAQYWSEESGRWQKKAEAGAGA
jgi:DNA polymerase-3 subunit chi